MDKPDAISVSALSFTYQRTTTPVLQGIEFHQPQGAFYAIVGPTGAGKSTFLRVLSGVVPMFFKGQIEGRIKLFDEDISGRSIGELSRTVGMVFQDFESQIFSTDVLLEVCFGMENLGIDLPTIRSCAGSVLAKVGLAGFEGRDVSTLSGGEKQRLAIAAILAMKPRLIVLDEPTTDLDPVGKQEVLAVVRQLADEGHTVLLVEHDCEELLKTDSIRLLTEGRIAAAGAPLEFFSDPEALIKSGVRPPEMVLLQKGLGLRPTTLEVRKVKELLAPDKFALDQEAVKRIEDEDRRTESNTEVLRLEAVSFGYQKEPVLRQVDLSFRQKEITAILGRNGSGKTTLVKLLNGLLRPDKGRVLLEGSDTVDLTVSALGRRIGFVFQNPDHQIFTASCREEVEFGLINHGVPKNERAEAIKKVLAAVNLSGYDDQDPYVMTKGERQRLAVASVLACEPEVIILDEPTTGLDYNEQQAMMELLVRLRDQGHAVVIVTHTMWVVAAYCDRVVLMSDGEVKADGPVREVFFHKKALSSSQVVPPPVILLAEAMNLRLLTVEEMLLCLRPKEDR